MLLAGTVDGSYSCERCTSSNSCRAQPTYSKPKQEAGLADPRVSDEEELEEVIAARHGHGQGQRTTALALSYDGRIHQLRGQRVKHQGDSWKRTLPMRIEGPRKVVRGSSRQVSQ